MDKIKVEVDWWDAHGSGTTAYAEHEIPHSAIKCTTTGWMLREDEIGITVAGEYCSDSTWRAVSFIPKGMVIEVRKPKVRLTRAKKRGIIVPTSEV